MCCCVGCGVGFCCVGLSMSKLNEAGGIHYRSLKRQVWDFVLEAGLSYLQGNIVKYLSRWRKKGGLDDLGKAVHYLDKLIESVDSGLVVLGDVSDVLAIDYCDVNNLVGWERELIVGLCGARSSGDLLVLRDLLSRGIFLERENFLGLGRSVGVSLLGSFVRGLLRS